jgi:hypothetical protein
VSVAAQSWNMVPDTRKRKMEDEDANTQKKTKKCLEPDNLVRVEIFKRNDKHFDGRLSRENLLSIWTEALHRNPSELAGFASVQIYGRALRINYRLTTPVVISSIVKKVDFEWERSSSTSHEFDVFTGRVIGLSAHSAAIGDTVTVCVSKTALEFSDAQLACWLEVYGKIEGRFVYHLDKLGFMTDNIEVELKLAKHIPEYLPMYGRKIRIYYVGMKKQCNQCLELGHIRSECENEKKDWFTFIEELIKKSGISLELFGEWPAVIKRKRAEIKKPESNPESKETDSKNAGRQSSKSNRGGRGRGRGRGK